LNVCLEGADLRYVAFNGSELIRRVYMAVRDLAWGTVPHLIVHREIAADDGRFRVRAELLHRHAEVAVSTEIEIHGHENGSIEYVMRARALESFEFAKIGLNIHHPIAGLVGRQWRGISSHGEWSGVIPKPIYPQIHLRTEGWDLPIFPPVHELWLDHEVGVLRFDFPVARTRWRITETGVTSPSRRTRCRQKLATGIKLPRTTSSLKTSA